MDGRRLRRVAGLLRARLPELDLEAVPDPRTRVDRWSIGQILRAALVGVMAGCKSLWETEQLTEALGPAARKALRLPRRLPDTTMRDALCRPKLVDGLRAALYRAIHAAWRRKALAPVGLPLGVVALDGKVTALPCINGEFAQTHHPEKGPVYGLVRTVTCALVSARGQPCLDAIPIPAHTNEMGHFQTVFASVERTYGKLFQMVTYDAGALSEANGSTVVHGGKDYLFSLKDENRTMLKLATEMLAPQETVARTVDVLDNQTTVTRTLKLIAVDPSWSYDQSKGPDESVWRHAQTFLAVESVTLRAGVVTQSETRYFVSSRASERLTPTQWLKVVRAHWGVENQNHHTLDTAFAEDDRPWIEADEYGMLALLLLRRIARTLLALFRERTLRSDEHRTFRWKDLLAWVRDALVAATDESFAGLRVREVAAAVD
ncbi:MAG TPA: ISAs1 family transposase [Anaeromyxobacteraceae bacterium]|nr:ISAs1 family transposase [Anaeromyxobacteraceae bacterium]